MHGIGTPYDPNNPRNMAQAAQNQACEPRRETQMIVAMRALGEAADYAERNMSALIEKLKPLIVPVPGKPEEADRREVTQVRAQLPQDIEVQAARVKRVAAAMEALVEKLEL